MLATLIPCLAPIGFRPGHSTGPCGTNVVLMHNIMDRFNKMLADLVTDPAFGNAHYVDVRSTLSTVLAGIACQEWWGNESHPTEKGFNAVADKFAGQLSKL